VRDCSTTELQPHVILLEIIPPLPRLFQSRNVVNLGVKLASVAYGYLSAMLSQSEAGGEQVAEFIP